MNDPDANPANSILLVEDNLSDIKLTQRAFKKSHIVNELVVVTDGVQALDYLHGMNGDNYINPLPALVLLDIRLPKMDGFEVLDRIRNEARTELLPAVMLTSSKEHEDIARSYRFGANSYIRKPVDFQQFLTAIEHLEIYWMVLNQRPYE